MKATLTVCASGDSAKNRAQHFALENNFDFSNACDSDFVLEFSKKGVRLLDMRSGKPVEIRVDFTAGTAAHRMKYGGGKSQAIAKAVGVSAQCKPRVLDATAGLGKDAFVLAGLGCEVAMLERSPLAFALLEDGLCRARTFVEDNKGGDEDALVARAVASMTLVPGDSLSILKASEHNAVNVVYLDPMFPERKKKAQVKKDMLAFQELLGKDEDSDALLAPALTIAENRVVVKRPNSAPFLGGQEPSYQLAGKTSRFDIYAKKKFS